MNISVKQAVPAWKTILGASGLEATKAAVTALTHAVRATLAQLEPGEVISTTDLGDRLWPKGERDANTLALRRRMFNLLLQEGNSMICPESRRRTDSAYINRYGVATHPWEWFNPDGVELPLDEKLNVGLASAASSEKALDELLAFYGLDTKQRRDTISKIWPKSRFRA